MRRALLLLMGLSLFGLTVAAASSFEANSEDLTAFSTPVSITVPGEELPGTVYLVADDEGGFTLSLVAPTPSNTHSERVLWSTTPLGSQTDDDFYVAFTSPPAPDGGYHIGGNVALYLHQNRFRTDRMTAALLSCPPTAPPASTGCTTLAHAVADVDPPPSVDTACVVNGSLVGPSGGLGFKERRVCFGDLDVTVATGRELRLKIVNQGPASLAIPDFRLSFGFNDARPSRLVTL